MPRSSVKYISQIGIIVEGLLGEGVQNKETDPAEQTEAERKLKAEKFREEEMA